jgi:aminotransferase
LNPGDEVILFEPYYGYHRNTLLAVEAVPRFVTLHPPIGLSPGQTSKDR